MTVVATDMRRAVPPDDVPTPPSGYNAYFRTNGAQALLSPGTPTYAADTELRMDGSRVITPYVSGVISFNGRAGAVTPLQADYDGFFLTPAEGAAAFDPLGAASTVQGNLTTHTGNTSNPHSTTAAQVGLGNVDNTSDANKPVSGPQLTALNLKAPLADPALTGNPTAPTQTPGNSSTRLATTAFVAAAITALINSSPAALDTLQELANALGNDANFATTVTNALAGKQPLDATLTALAGQNWVANSAPVGNGVDSMTQLAFAAGTLFGRSSAGNIEAKPASDYFFTTLAQLANQTALTAQVNIASATVNGALSASQFRKLRDKHIDVVNDLGADPTGAVDATAIIQAWINGLSNSGVLFIPAATRIRVDGPVLVNKEITVIGAERRTSIIGTGHATNTQFDVTMDGCVFENMRFEAGTTAQNLALRSNGYCVDIDATSNGSGLYNCDIIGHWSGVNLEGQLGFIDGLNMREYGALAGSGSCVRVNTPSAGGDTIIRRMLTDNGSNVAGYAGIRVINCASLILDSLNIIHATVNLAVEPSGTVPSIKASNSFFDNGTHGIRLAGAGVWYRSEFVNCWMGSNTVAGVEFSTANFDGIEFTNCAVLGNPIGFDANAGGGRWTINGGCKVAGSSTAGIRLAASTNHFPMIQGNRIRPQVVGGAFGPNAVGIIVGAGAYDGLVIQGNDMANNTSPITLGAVTIAGNLYNKFRITDNAGLNPRGGTGIAAPAIGAAGTVHTNTTGFRIQANVKFGATAPATTVVNGVASAAGLANQLFPIQLDPGSTISFTTTAPTSWTWSAM